MDEVDQTADRAEREAPLLLRASKKPEGPKPTGFCAFCDEELADSTARFCDAGCRDDYEKQQRRNVVNGRKTGL